MKSFKGFSSRFVLVCVLTAVLLPQSLFAMGRKHHGSTSSAPAQTVPAPAPVLKNFQYWVRIPATLNSCDQEAMIFGNKFATATKKEVVESHCKGIIPYSNDGQNYPLYSLILTYKAENLLTPESTILGDVMTSEKPSDLSGIFTAYRDCINALPVQTSIFEGATALTAMSATCLEARTGNYNLVIDAFGTPKKRLFGFNSGNGFGDAQAEIQQLLINLNARIALNTGTTTLYYSEEKIPARTFNFGFTDSFEHCTAQAEEARRIFINSGSTQTILRCTAITYPGMPEGGLLNLLGDSDAAIANDYAASKVIYYSYAECMDDRSRVLEEKRSMGEKPLGAICTPNYKNRNLFTMDVYKVL